MADKTMTTDPRPSTSDRIAEAQAKVADAAAQVTVTVEAAAVLERRHADLTAQAARATEEADIIEPTIAVLLVDDEPAGKAARARVRQLRDDAQDATDAAGEVAARLDAARREVLRARARHMTAHADLMRLRSQEWGQRASVLLGQLAEHERCGYVPEAAVFRANRGVAEARAPLSETGLRQADKLAGDASECRKTAETGSAERVAVVAGRPAWAPDESQRLIGEGRLGDLPAGVNVWSRQSGLSALPRPTVHLLIEPTAGGGPGPYANPAPYAR